MKLIVSREDGNHYAYTESEERFKASEEHVNGGSRAHLKKLDTDELKEECWLESYGDDFYFVFDVEEP